MTLKECHSYIAAQLCNDHSIHSEIPVKKTTGESHLGLRCPQLQYGVNHGATDYFKKNNILSVWSIEKYTPFDDITELLV